MKRDAMRADVLKRLETCETGLRSAEIAALYGINSERHAAYIMDSLRPAVVSVRFFMEGRWVLASREAEIRAALAIEREARDLKARVDRLAKQTETRAQKRRWAEESTDWTPPGQRVASVWDLARVSA